MKPLIVANWKTNPSSLSEAELIVNKTEELIDDSSEVVICPPFPFLERVGRLIKRAKLGAQDVGLVATGEVTPNILKEIGVQYLIIGHSERRRKLAESNELINQKVKDALAVGLSVILCVGEDEGEDAEEVIGRQLLEGVTIAYEPVWAIGTGKTPSLEEAEKVRSFIYKRTGAKRILYGGSVNSSNASDYLTLFSGLLVGRASLDPVEFAKIASKS